jgi:imidazolonepropionase-like amidohydrolase
MRPPFALLRALALVALASPLPAQQVLVLRGARILTATGSAIPNGTLVVRDGKIAAVGANVSVPAGATVVDVAGKDIIPGLIDNHSHIGAAAEDLNEFPASFASQNRMLDALDFDDPQWKVAYDGGVTTVATGTGSGEVSSGEAVVIKTFGPSLEARLLREHGGIKFAMGRKGPQRPPSTAPAVTSALRQKFIQAREYMAAIDRWEKGGKQGPPPPRDLQLEALARVLSGEEDARVHIHTAHDIMAMLRLKDEFGFDLTLHHATEAYKLVDEIRKRHVNVVGMPLFFRFGMSDEIMATGATMAKAGVTFAFHTDDPVVPSKWYRQTGGVGMRYGMTEEQAIEALTINGAKIARVDKRVGSLEPGKDADFVVTDGPWYELGTRVDRVYVDGVLAYDRAKEER